MTNEEKAKQISNDYPMPPTFITNGDVRVMMENSALQMSEWKDEQPISEQGGWHEEEPTEDGWYLVDTPDFPKNCYFVVAEWDNNAKHFYSEATDEPIDYEKWKLVEKS